VIFVDTSVWVAALRSTGGPEAGRLGQLLDLDEVALPIPVRIEILVGASVKDLARLRRVLSALPVYHPTAVTWEIVDSWLDRAAAAGERFGFADLLIAALSVENHGALWSLDRDFQRLARIGLVTLFAPPGRG